MRCIEIWLFPLDERAKAEIYYGGEQMDKTRALFRALLPPGDTLYTAAEIVRRYFPGIRKKTHPELCAIYEAHHKALNRLMRDSIYYAKPGNLDPEIGQRPPGKGKGARQPRRWSRATWLLLLSDDVYEWLLDLRQKLIKQAAAHPEGTRFFCELQTFTITFEEAPTVIPEEEPELSEPAAEEDQATKPGKEPGPDEEQTAGEEPRRADPARVWRRTTAAALAVAALLLAVILWPKVTPGAPNNYHAELNAEQTSALISHIKANQNLWPANPTPNPAVNKAARWNPDPVGTMVAPATPPTTFLGGEPWF